MKKLISIGSDCSGVGALIHAIKRLGIDYKEDFACDFDYYARVSYLANHGIKEDVDLALSKEHKYFADNVKRISLSNTECSDKDLKILSDANEFAKKFSFYYPFSMYQREIPKEPCGLYVSTVPCQAFSLAGKRLGKDDEKGRGILFFNSHEFIQKNKPRYFIFENVKGLLSDDSGKTFGEWIGLLGGKSVNGNICFFPHKDSVPYHIYWKVMNAKHHNVPQNRERVFIVGIRDDEDNSFSFPKEEFLTKRLKDVLEKNVDDKYFLSEKMIDGLLNRPNENYKFNPHDENTTHSSCLTARYFKMRATDPYIKIKSATSQGYEIATNLDSINFSNPDSKTRRGRVGKEVAQTLDTSCNQGVVVGTWRTHDDGKGFRATEDNNCPTIPARAREDGSGQPVVCQPVLTPDRLEKRQNGRRMKDDGEEMFTITAQDKHGVFDGYTIRRLTPFECFRLMDFPDNHVTKCKEAGISDSQLYKQAGNSIVVRCLELIIKQFNLK
jgi:DNA (cytosine-5)-methyltransferase 1